MKKKIIIILGVILFVALGLISIYRFYIYPKSENADFETVKITRIKSDVQMSKKDLELYGDEVITEEIKEYNFELVSDDKGINGKVYIGEDKKLYINKNNDKLVYKISDVAFKTLYRREESKALLTLYALSESGEVYYIYLNKLDITKTEIAKILFSLKVKNFVNLEFKSIYDITLSNVMVLAENDNIYELRTGIRYNPNAISLLEKYYVLEDKVLLNRYGKILENSESEEFKIKYYVEIRNENELFPDTSNLIITKDYRVIYIKNNDDSNLLIYNKKIKELEYTIKEDRAVDLDIEFEDKTFVTIKGYYTEYYGFE